jgi:hypothetical protein
MANIASFPLVVAITGDNASTTCIVSLGYTPTTSVATAAYDANYNSVLANISSVTPGALQVTINFVTAFSGTIQVILAVTNSVFSNAQLQPVTQATPVWVSSTRPAAFGALGAYSFAKPSGTMAAGLAAGAPIWSLRWTNTNLCLVQSVRISVMALGTAFTAGQMIFDLITARSFTVSDTGGNAYTLTTNNGKKRTSMGSTLIASGDLRIATTGTLTAGTRTLDNIAQGEIMQAASAVANTSFIQNVDFIDFAQGADNHPIILAQNEGLVIQATVPATGTWAFSVSVDTIETASYTGV